MSTRTILALLLLTACSEPNMPTALDADGAVAGFAVSVDPVVILNGASGLPTGNDAAHGISSAAAIVGASAGYAVLWPVGSVSAAIVDGPYARAIAINAHGQIAGDFDGQAALWTPASGGYARTAVAASLAPVLSYAWAINGHGQVVGIFRERLDDGRLVDRCFLWTPAAANGTTGTVTVIDPPGSTWCTANDINAQGQVAGARVQDAIGGTAFLWTPAVPNGMTGSAEELSPGTDSYATSLNDAGQVAGQRLAGGAANAAIWTPGGGGWTVVDLGTWTGDVSWVTEINDAGHAIGYARRIDAMEDDAFFWRSGEFSHLPGTGAITNPEALTNVDAGRVRVVGASRGGSGLVALRWDVTVAAVTPEGCLDELARLIEQLRAAGVLGAGEARSLLAKVDAAARQLEDGHTTAAANVMGAFIGAVDALVGSERLTPEQAAPLLDGAHCVIDAL